MTDLITFTGPFSGKLIGFRGTEAMSRPYQFEVFVQTADVELETAAGAPAAITIDRGTPGFVPFVFAGMLANVQVVHAVPGQLLVQATMVPKLWKARLSQHSRIFTMMRIPDIIALVLGENGVPFELRLMGSYDVEEHVCQYRETDFDFISRWMEKEGIFYWFEHSAGGEMLILSDSPAYDQDPAGGLVPYHPQLGGHNNTVVPSFRAFSGGQRTLSNLVRQRDYDYMMPMLPIEGASPAQPTGQGQEVRWGERSLNPAVAQKYATVRAQELLAREQVATGKANRFYLRPGYVFTVEGHPYASFNAPYVTIEARHSANQAVALAAFRDLTGIHQDDVYLVEVDAIPAPTQFRAESVTPWARAHSYEIAVIDGPADGPFAQIDDQGRYKVKFKFDESALQAGMASTWVRMMQPHGGDIEGFHFPLRKGAEVMICFLDGDVDRPVIFGFVPNPTHPSPVTASNNTRNVVQTGGKNRFEFEDIPGLQWAHLSTPSQKTHLYLGANGSEGDHNFILETQGTGHLHTGDKWDADVDTDWTVKVGSKLKETVQSTVTEQYQSDTSQTVQGKKTHMVVSGQVETINSGSTQSISGGFTRTVTGPYTNTLLGPHSQMHNGTHVLIHNGTLVYVHNGAHEYFHSGPHTHTRAGDTTETRNGDVSRTVTGDVGENVTGSVKWDITGGVTVGCQQAWSVNSKTGADFVDPVHFKVQVGGSSLTIEPSKITLDNGTSKITLDGGQVTVYGPKVLVCGGDITVASSGPLALDGNTQITMSGGPLIKADAGEILLNNG